MVETKRRRAAALQNNHRRLSFTLIDNHQRQGHYSHVMSIYSQLTDQFNTGQTRAVLAGGQAVVMHGLAMMSKDGDWVVREKKEACDHILGVLAQYGASYRFGAPLDIQWLAGGWSAHLEFMLDGVRVRTDFVSRPPRLTKAELAALWQKVEATSISFTPPAELAEMKKTVREKDYAVIGELARLMEDPERQLLYSRSARDIIDLAARHPDLASVLSERRPVLRAIDLGRDALEEALDRERRQLIRADEDRLKAYMTAASPWADVWPETQRILAGLPLKLAHAHMVERAAGLLPQQIEGQV
jgi:hypothetical protein